MARNRRGVSRETRGDTQERRTEPEAERAATDAHPVARAARYRRDRPLMPGCAPRNITADIANWKPLAPSTFHERELEPRQAVSRACGRERGKGRDVSGGTRCFCASVAARSAAASVRRSWVSRRVSRETPRLRPVVSCVHDPAPSFCCGVGSSLLGQARQCHCGTCSCRESPCLNGTTVLVSRSGGVARIGA